MGVSEWIAIAGVAVGVVGILTGSIIGIIQIKKANKKELSFPTKSPHTHTCFIEPFDENATGLYDFIFDNIQKRVFLNIAFMDDNASYYEDSDLNPSVMFRVEKYDAFDHNKIKPTTDNSLALSLNFKGIKDSSCNVYSWQGQTKINGYFTIVLTGGPHMGEMWATLKADKPN